MERRQLLRSGLLLPLVAAAANGSAAFAPDADLLPAHGSDPVQLAADEAYWRRVAALYDITDEVVLLENGYFGAMARPVLEAYQRHLARVNRGNAWYARQQFPGEVALARGRVARMLGVEDDEIVFTRGATEALQALIGGYRGLRPGDAVLYADLDYDSMISAMRWLGERRGVEVVGIALPEPATHQGLLDAYADALDRHPNLRLMLLTQVSHRNGVVLPVAEITRMARRRGVDVIVDVAHGVGQLDFRLPDLDVDFAGINLHKWIGAPVGVGALYIKRGRVADIAPYMGEVGADDDIRTRIHTGTANFATFLATTDALDVHEAIGVAAKQARLRLLRDRWMDGVRGVAGIELISPADPRLSSAIAAFRLRGQVSVADNVATARRLANEFGIFTVHRDGLASGACVRVTPSVFTPLAHVDRLVQALQAIAQG